MKEKIKKTCLVYRAQNPLCEAIEEKFKGEITPFSWDPNFLSNPQIVKKFLKDLNGQYELILTDNNFFHLTKNLSNDKTEDSKTLKSSLNERKLSLYFLLDINWLDEVRAVTDHLKNRKKKTPVINDYGLNDHLSSGDKDLNDLKGTVGDEKYNKLKSESIRFVNSSYGNIKYPYSTLIAYLLGEITGTKVIQYKGNYPNENKPPFYMYYRDGEYRKENGASFNGNILDSLKDMNVNPEDSVVLVDHHVYHLSEESINKSGFSNLKIYPICSCCVTDPSYLKNTKFQLEVIEEKYMSYMHKGEGSNPISNLV